MCVWCLYRIIVEYNNKKLKAFKNIQISFKVKKIAKRNLFYNLIKKYKILFASIFTGTVLVILFLYFYYDVWGDPYPPTMIFRDYEDFASGHNYYALAVHAATTLNCSSESCHELCSRDESCRVFVTSQLEAEGSCYMFNSTPYYLGSKVVPRRGWSAYLKKSELKNGTIYDDGLYYFIGDDAVPLGEAVEYCRRNSDFYHLAIQNENTLAQYLAKLLSILKAAQSEGVEIGVFYEAIYFDDSSIEESIIGKDLPLFKSPGDGIGKLHSVYMYFLFGHWIALSKNDVKGFPLCQGDPWNMHQLHDVHSLLPHAEKLDRKQAMEKYLRGTGDQIIYRVG